MVWFLLVSYFSNVGVHVTFYIELFISILFASIKTLRVSNLDTPSFDVPVVTGLGEGDRQTLYDRSLTGVL